LADALGNALRSSEIPMESDFGIHFVYVLSTRPLTSRKGQFDFFVWNRDGGINRNHDDSGALNIVTTGLQSIVWFVADQKLQ